MTADTFFKVMIWLQGACAIQHAPMKGMIDILFNELKNKFDDKTIVTAAREIATKEELYGNYPSLRVWLKYCPVTKTERAENDQKKATFLELVSAIMWLDHMLFICSSVDEHLCYFYIVAIINNAVRKTHVTHFCVNVCFQFSS